MINRMNKHITTLSWSDMLGLERKEHGITGALSSKKLANIERKEHGLSKNPTNAQILKAESIEHKQKKGGFGDPENIVVRAKATKSYRAK